VLTREYQTDPARHDIGAPEPDGREARHVFWRVEQPNRTRTASRLVQTAGPTIVFCRTRHGADRLAKQLAKDGVRADAIHGGRSQNQRDRALAAFTDGRVDALVATDVAARGIHVDGVACVVHFDTPEDEKAYLHRSGRTARAGASGLVVSFVPQSDRRTVTRMQRVLNIPGELTHPDFEGLDRVDVVRPERKEQSEPTPLTPARARRNNRRRAGSRGPRNNAERRRRAS
jgi:superfamily II DNA/RNA helicase